jgi:molecular chaperone GrpE
MNDSIDSEAILARFQEWMREAREEARNLALMGANHHPLDASKREFGLIDLVEEFTALRQELKLETKSTRGLREQAEALLASLQQAMEHFRSVVPKEEQAAWTAGKGLAEGLASLDEALDRGRTEIEKARGLLVDQAFQSLETALGGIYKSQTWLNRRLSRRYHEQVMECLRRERKGVRQQWFDSLLEGFGLMQSRLNRVMKEDHIERIECLSRQVDPDRMIVAEVIHDPDRPNNIVIEELRRGYLWRGRVLRYAEVRASRGGPEMTEARLSGDEYHESVDYLAEGALGEDGPLQSAGIESN